MVTRMLLLSDGHEKIFGHLGAQHRELFEDVGQEGDEPALQDAIHASEAEPSVQLPRETLTFEIAVLAQVIEVLECLLCAKTKAARHLAAQDQELGHAVGVDDIAKDLVVRTKCAHRAKDGAPSIVSLPGPGLGSGQALVPGSEQPRSVVCSLEKRSEKHEVKRIVVQGRAVGDALEEVGTLYDPYAKLTSPTGAHL